MDGFDAVTGNLPKGKPLSVLLIGSDACMPQVGIFMRFFLSIRRCVNCENSYLMDSYLYDGVLETTGIICSNRSV